MATLNQITLPAVLGDVLSGQLLRNGSSVRIQNESVSFSSSAGLNVSNRTVPANRFWLVQSMRLLSAEVSKYYEFYADDGSTSHMTFHDVGGFTLPATASDPVGVKFAGPGLLVPPGWRLGIKIDGAVGALSTNWQHYSIEVALDL